jgi:hypothetical protein
MALICAYFCAEDEMFGVFKAWAQENANTERGKDWARRVTLESLRREALGFRAELEMAAFGNVGEIAPPRRST